MQDTHAHQHSTNMFMSGTQCSARAFDSLLLSCEGQLLSSFCSCNSHCLGLHSSFSGTYSWLWFNAVIMLTFSKAWERSWLSFSSVIYRVGTNSMNRKGAKSCSWHCICNSYNVKHLYKLFSVQSLTNVLFIPWQKPCYACAKSVHCRLSYYDALV